MDLPDLVVEHDDAEPSKLRSHEVWEGEHPGAEYLSDPRDVNNDNNERCLKKQTKVGLIVDHQLLSE